jgi:hypothetical protein
MYDAWTFDSNGEGKDYWQFGENALVPGDFNTVYYDVLAKDVLGWETAQVKLISNLGDSNSFGVATVPIPEPMTLTLLASGAAVFLAGRRIKEHYKQTA